MDYLPLPDDAARQIIDTQTLFEEMRRVRERARSYTGGMYWKREGGYEYLVKTRPPRTQERLGARSPELEAVHKVFHDNKARWEGRLAELRRALKQTERLNKAVRAGRTPRIVIDILNKLEEAGLARHFKVVGTNAIYAYETAAGVRVASGALATQDVDLLWDARKRVQFVTDMKHLDKSMIALLREVDPSFERKEMQKEAAVNARGFEVEFLRRAPEDGDPHPFPLSEAENELFAVQAPRGKILTESPVFEHVVIGATGTVAVMRTIAPFVFVDIKRWIAQRNDRPALKRQRDLLQANIVQSLIDEGLLPRQ